MSIRGVSCKKKQVRARAITRGRIRKIRKTNFQLFRKKKATEINAPPKQRKAWIKIYIFCLFLFDSTSEQIQNPKAPLLTIPNPLMKRQISAIINDLTKSMLTNPTNPKVWHRIRVGLRPMLSARMLNIIKPAIPPNENTPLLCSMILCF